MDSEKCIDKSDFFEQIYVEKRISDYKAWMKDHPDIIEHGRTPAEAVGNLIFTCYKEIPIRVYSLEHNRFLCQC